MSLKGIDIIGTGAPIVVEASLKDPSGAKITTGSATVALYEFQSDGTLKSYDFNSNTFKTTALTTATAALTHRTGNNSNVNTGVWTYAHATVTGFTRGSRYMWQVSHASAIPPQQERKFQYGDGEGDLTVASTGHALSDVSDVSLSEIFKAIYRCQSVVFVNENADDDSGDGLKPSTAKKTIDAMAVALGRDGGAVLFPGVYTASTAIFTDRTALFGAGPTVTVLNGAMTFSGSNRTDGIALGGTIGIMSGALAVSDYLAFGTPAITGTVVGLDGVRPATLLRPMLVDATGNVSVAGVYLATGTVASTTGATTTLDAGSVGETDYYVGDVLVITAGTGAGQDKIITAYSSGRIATHAAWVTNPDAASTYQVRAGKTSATVTGNSLSQDESDTLDRIDSNAAMISAGGFYITNRVANNNLIIWQGETWQHAEGTHETITKGAGEVWPTDLTGYTITSTITQTAANTNTGSSNTLAMPCTISQATGASQAFYIETGTQTANLPLGDGTRGYDWTVSAVKGSVVAVLRAGTASVKRRL